MRLTLKRCLLASLLACALSPARSVATCSCPPPASVADAFASSFAVFSCRVVGFGPVGPTGVMAAFVHPIERWSGTLRSDPLPVVPEPGCEYPFVLDGEYLVYANSLMDIGVTHDFVPVVSQCTRTAPLAGNPDLALLPPPVLPVPARGRTWGTLKQLYR